MSDTSSCTLDGPRMPGPLPPTVENSRPTSILGTLWWALFGIDTRSLALFRIGLALLVLTDLYFRSGSIRAFYTDNGLFTRAQSIEFSVDNPYLISLHMLSGAYFVQVTLFLIAALFAVMLLVGYRTRLATVMSWVFLCSIHARNPQVLQGGDVLFRCLLFWGMMLPLGASFSVDRARASNVAQPLPRTISTIPCMALLLQVCFLYLFTSALKSHSDWRIERTAVFYALSIDQLATPLGEWMLQFRGLLKDLTAATIIQESYGVYLAFAPGILLALIGRWRLVPTVTQWARLVTVTLFVGFHIGLASCMELGPFPYICWVAWTPFLPTMFWDGLRARWARRAPSGLTLWYDEDCGFCKSMTRLIETFWLLPPHAVRSCQSDPEIFELMRRENSWVVTTGDGQRHVRFAAVGVMMRHSQLLAPFAWLLRRPGLRTLGDHAYRLVASHRGTAGKALFFMHPHELFVELRPKAQLVLDLLAAVLIYYVLLWNFRTLHAGADFNTCWATRFFPTSDNWILEIPRLDQYWSMFSPMPLRDDGWYVTIATLADGSKIDVLTGKTPVDTSVTPPHLANQYHDERWRKYLMNLYSADFNKWKIVYAHWLVNEWNRKHGAEIGKMVVHLELVFWKKTNRYDGAPVMTRLSLAKIN